MVKEGTEVKFSGESLVAAQATIIRKGLATTYYNILTNWVDYFSSGLCKWANHYMKLRLLTEGLLILRHKNGEP